MKTRSEMILALAGLVMMTSACGPSVSSSTGDNGQAGEEAHVHTNEFMSAGSREQVAAALVAGEVEFRPRASTNFRGFLIHATNYKRYELEVSYEFEDGTRSEFFGVEPDEPEYPFMNAAAVLDRPATALFVRAVEGAADMEFLAVRFFDEIPEDGALAIHLDDYDVDLDPDALPLDTLETAEQFLVRRQELGSRYIPPASVVAAGRQQSVRYEAAPSWNPSQCSGTFHPGTRALGEHLKSKFSKVTHIGGYSCRRNTASPSKMSVHGTGRAIDVHLNEIGGDADNASGDPVANWLIMNAQNIGVQYLIWDQTSWGAHRSGDKHRKYNAIPHTDHLHVEVTSAGARMSTPFFRDSSVAVDAPGSSGTPDPGTSSPGSNIGAEGVTCHSSTLGRRVPSGSCVQMSYVKYGGRCNWATCSSQGGWVRGDANACAGTTFSNPSCGGVNQPTNPGTSNSSSGSNSTSEPTPTGQSCFSRTLGRRVDHGTCVQVDYVGRTCSRCGWYSCEDGAWMCTDSGSCSGEKNAHASCPEEEPMEVDGLPIGEQMIDYFHEPEDSSEFKPLRSVAFISLSEGTLLYLEDFDGMEIPEVDGVGGFTHNGCFRVDTAPTGFSSAIQIYTGKPEMTEEMEKLLEKHTEVKALAHAKTKCEGKLD